MSLSETITFTAFIAASAFFFYRWFKFISDSIKTENSSFSTTVLCLIPFLTLIINLITLTTLASFDVVDSFLFITYYVAMGFSCLYLCVILMFVFFDLSWIDDVLNMKNPAAALAVAGGALGTTLVYAGANIGDGPGWWCVFFAGGLGLIFWFILGVVINSITKVFKKITIGRDINCGIRTCAYLVSSGIILGRASAGDWTSFSSTVAEFVIGWPVLLLAVLFIVIELLVSNDSEQAGRNNNDANFSLSLFIGLIYIAAAICAVFFLPDLSVTPYL